MKHAKDKPAPQLGARGEGNKLPEIWQSLQRKARPRTLPFTDVKSSREDGAPFAILQLRGTVAPMNTLSSLGAGRSPAHQNSGDARSAGRKEHAMKSEGSIARCTCMSSKEKTQTYKGRGSGQGGRKKGRYTPRHARRSNTPSQGPQEETNLEGHIQRANPKEYEEKRKSDNTLYGNGATPGNAGRSA